MIRFLIVAIAFICAAELSAEEIRKFKMNDGSIIKGKIIEEAPGNYYMVETDNGSQIKLQIKEIQSIILDKPVFDNSYPEVGFSFLLPGIINLNLGYTFEDIGIMLTGGPFGFEFGPTFKLSHRKQISHELVVPFGAFFSTDYNNYWYYTGASYKLWISGFQFMAGLTLGSGDFSNPQIHLQIGYVYRFN